MNTLRSMERQLKREAKLEYKANTRNSFPKGTNPKYKQYYVSSKKNALIFEFDEQEFINYIEEECYYCGKSNSQGIDKIDPKGHYKKDNCVPCCKMCNTMKFIYSKEEFLAHVNRIHTHNAMKDNTTIILSPL